MKTVLTFTFLFTCVLTAKAQTKMDSIFSNESVRLQLKFARKASSEPFKDSYDHILDFKKVDDSTTVISYYTRQYMDGEFVAQWDRKVENSSLKQFKNGLQNLYERPNFSAEVFAYMDVETPLDYFIIKTKKRQYST